MRERGYPIFSLGDVSSKETSIVQIQKLGLISEEICLIYHCPSELETSKACSR
jgi:hypothetical protein